MQRYYIESGEVATRMVGRARRSSSFGGGILDASGFLVRSHWESPLKTLPEIAEAGNAILIAECGMGKTFALEEFKKGHPDDVELLYASRFLGKPERLEEAIEKAAGKKYLLIDGLDEAVELCTDLYWFLQQAHLTGHVVLSSRSITQLRSFCLLPQWSLFSLLPFTKDDVRELCETEKKDFNAFMREVEGNGLGGFCAKPLGCRMLLSVFDGRNRRYQSIEELWRNALLQLCSENVLSQTRPLSKVSVPVNPNMCWDLAMRAALVLKLAGKSILTRISPMVPIGNGEVDFAQIFPDEVDKFNECLLRPLFSPIDHDKFIFSHASFLDFMAAMGIMAHIEQSQWKKFVLSEEGVPYPQWEGVIPWLAARDGNILEHVKKSRPDLLLGFDALIAKVSKKEICQSILDNAENIPNTIRENPAIRAKYFSLDTDECAKVVEKALQNSPSAMVVDTAIDIVQQSRHPSMVDVLVKIFCNETEEIYLREKSGIALLNLANDQQRERCRTLLEMPLSRRMQGLALHLLWPNHMTTAELLPRLVLAETDSLDPYEYWLEYQFPGTFDGLSDADRRAMFRWAIADLKEDKHGHHRRFAVKLCIFLHCWKKSVARDDFELMAQGLAAFSQIYFSPFSDQAAFGRIKNDYGWKDYVADVDRRRNVARTIVEDGACPIQVFGAYCIQLLFPNDVEFVIGEIRNSTLARHRERWAFFLKCIVGGLVLPKDADTWDWLHQEFPRVFQSDARTVMAEGKKYDRKIRRFKEKQLKKTDREKSRRATIHEQNTQWVLAQFRNNTVSQNFCNIMAAIQMQTPHKAPDYGFDFRKSALWQVLTKREIDMLVVAANEFLLEYAGPWPKGNGYYPSHIQAFYLLAANARECLMKLPAAVWEKFTPELMEVFLDDSFDLAKQTFEVLAEQQGGILFDAIAGKLKKLLISCGAVAVHEFETLIGAGDVMRLLGALDSEELDDQKRHNLYAEFWRLDAQQTAKYIKESRFANLPLKESGLQTSEYLIASNPEKRFPELLELLRKDVLWGRSWSVQTLGRSGFGHSPFLDALQLRPVTEVKEIYAWLLSTFPAEKRLERLDCSIPDAIEEIACAMSRIFGELTSREDKALLPALEELAAQFPQLTNLNDAVLQAKRMFLEKSCPTYDVPFIKKLLLGQENVVHTATDLLDVVFDMLREKYQMYLTGKETPMIRDLWNDPNGGKEGLSHKDEAALSNHIKSYLAHKFPKFVISREVELNRGSGDVPGAQTDIWITAFSHCDNTQLRLCIEVKGSWNPSCSTAFYNQLCKKYMGDGGADAGIFLVGWFWSEQNTSHKNQWHDDRSEAERVLQQQERELSQQGYKVRHLILDCKYCR